MSKYEKRSKNYRQKIQKQVFYSNSKQTLQNVIMKTGLILKLYCIIISGKRNLV